MTSDEQALRYLADANPVRDPTRLDQVSLESIDMGAASWRPVRHPDEGTMRPTPGAGRRLSRWAVTIAAAAGVAAGVGAWLVFGGGGDGSPVTRGTEMPADEMAATTLPQGATSLPAASLGPIIAPTEMGLIGLERSGGSLWAWGADEIWRYADGAWSRYAPTPSPRVRDVAFGLDVLWAEDGGSVWSFDGSSWRRLPELVDAPGESMDPEAVGGTINYIETDPRGDALWISRRHHLYGWDGTTVTYVRSPLDDYVFAVGADGSVWVGDELIHYDNDTGSWETVLPDNERTEYSYWPGIVTTAPGGDVWVGYMTGWCAGTITRFARLDAATGQWSAYPIAGTNESLHPAFMPIVAAADDDGIWLAQGLGSCGSFTTGGIQHFDGSSWSTYLGGADIHDLAVAPDGTIWYTVDSDRVHVDRVHQLTEHQTGRSTCVTPTEDGWVVSATCDSSP